MPEPQIKPGDVITGFDHQLPVEASVCEANIVANLERGLREALRRKKITVIANGPTARNVDLALIRPTLALNGSLKLFTDKGLAPDFWACCDPQPLVADFLDEAPYSTVYYVASKCHPSVFEKLKDRDVRVWHLRDHEVPGKARVSLATSITMSASWLFQRLGYTDFDYYGWDGCFLDGRHHASDDSDWSTQPIMHFNYGGEIAGEDVIGGETFTTTRSWVCESKDAEKFFQIARYLDMKITVHGPGMFAAAKRFIEA